MSSRFVHLRAHSEFSIDDGILRVRDAVTQAGAEGMPALALTDSMNLFGLVKFYKAARENGVKPIAGADCWITNPEDPNTPHRLLLLVRQQKGYLQLSEMLTRAYTAPKRPEKAQIHPDWFREVGADGLIALSGAEAGDVGEAIRLGNLSLARARAEAWLQRFPEAFYLEVQRYGQKGAAAFVEATAHLAGISSIPLVATHPVQFLTREDFRAHEARVCIAEGHTLGSPRRPRVFTEEQYFKSSAEMTERFADLPEALENSLEIAQRCNLELTLGQNFLPRFPTPEGMSLEDYLTQEARTGLERRLARLFPEEGERARRKPEYEARLETELATIIQMGFPGYFLIVADFINWGKANGVPVGPGRGSGAGSLVAFCLGITDLDPLPYALLFERFLNPERVSMPDFDIDFCQDNRGRVIEYVRARYGADAVSQIVTFGTMSSKAVIRDVGRVLDLPYSLCDRLSKLIPVEQNKPLSLTEALKKEPALQEMMEDPQDGESVRELFDLALRLEDLTRNVGMHAGGVLIAPGRITDFCPIYQASGNDAAPVSQFDKDDVEKIGLVKFDFLGLRNLTIIRLALDYVERLTGNCPDLATLGLDDPAAYRILKEANTTAIFQLESEGMKKLLKKLEPDCFEDIIAVLALYRPGPLGSGMVDDFILRKKGRQKIDYFHDDLRNCLAPTYGVIVYQEQVMQISQIIGGYTLGGADLLRRAMGKKKPEEMARHRTTIAEGAKRQGYDPRLAEQLFDLMTKFAEYGFNKSHTAAYAVITYQTAWLKAHHCAAFMAATLSSDMDDTDAIKIFRDDALLNGMHILGPDINASAFAFEPVDSSTIRYGLGAVKGVGEQAVRLILAERQKAGPYRDLFDFCVRVDKRQVNRRAIESLVRAGAFDALDPDRAKLLASVGIAIEAADQAERHAQQTSLFDALSDPALHAPQYVCVPPWSDRERLLHEKEALGFFFSGHPFDSYRKVCARFVRGSLKSLEVSRETTLLVGIVAGLRTQLTRRGKRLIVQLDDGNAQVEVSVFGDLDEAGRAKAVMDEILFVEGRVSHDEFSDSLRVTAERLLTLGEVRSRFARHLALDLNGLADASRLKTLLSAFSGATAVRLRYRNDHARCELALSAEYRVSLEDALLAELRDWLNPENVEIIYA
ncbi:MAG: DNA polymerase III subunit alpha [Zoogloeaceae bacterium]|jgi:DNA polymerase-3 subunit alpha|nr:DNA polymerase III subunit alpha [Zoogloeaceae bacterium]